MGLLKNLFRSAIAKEGKTQADFAKTHGVSGAYISQIVNERKKPSPKFDEAIKDLIKKHNKS